MVTKLLAFKTGQQQAAAEKNGKIEGHFGRVAKGRPVAGKAKALPMNMSRKDVITKGEKGSKTSCANWNPPENFHLLKTTVLEHIAAKNQSATQGKDNDENAANSEVISIVLRTTLQRHVDRFKAVAKEKKKPIHQLHREDVFPKCRGGGKGLLKENDIESLASALICRDEANIGMSRNEAIALVMELAQTSDRTAAENHFDHLLRKKQLIGVKNFGRTVKAQATATKRTQIAIDQQLRWRTCIEEALEFQKRVNLPTEECEKVQDCFLGNLEETCLMANADGSVRVMASQAKKKTEKNTDDSRASIASLRIGMTSGNQGPFAFLAKGSRMDRPSITKLLKEQCPAGSQVVMSPSACMTDKAHLALAPQFALGIRSMKVIKDHPDWWMTVTCDGFGSHIVDKPNELFAKHKIQIVKEEGDTSQVKHLSSEPVARPKCHEERQVLHASQP